MASSRRLSNGRSPLVNQQRQITSFFSPGKKNPNHNASPSTPQDKQKKPLLVVGPTPQNPFPSPLSDATPSPKSGKKSYSEGVVEKKIRVFWPLDKSWYEGCMKSFDKLSGKHVVQYDDAEEEILDLGVEKIELVEDAVRSFRRLRRNSVREVVEVEKQVLDDGSGGDDDSMDEDWGKCAGKEKVVVVDDDDDDDDDDLEDLELEEDEEKGVGSVRRGRVGNSVSRKRKPIEKEKSGSGKKSRVGGIGEMLGLKVGLGKSVDLATIEESK